MVIQIYTSIFIINVRNLNMNMRNTQDFKLRFTIAIAVSIIFLEFSKPNYDLNCGHIDCIYPQFLTISKFLELSKSQLQFKTLVILTIRSTTVWCSIPCSCCHLPLTIILSFGSIKQFAVEATARV